MDTEPYPVVAGLLIRNLRRSRGRFRIPKYEMAMNTESGHVVDSVSRPR